MVNIIQVLIFLKICLIFKQILIYKLIERLAEHLTQVLLNILNLCHPYRWPHNLSLGLARFLLLHLLHFLYFLWLGVGTSPELIERFMIDQLFVGRLPSDLGVVKFIIREKRLLHYDLGCLFDYLLSNIKVFLFTFFLELYFLLLKVMLLVLISVSWDLLCVPRYLLNVLGDRHIWLSEGRLHLLGHVDDWALPECGFQLLRVTFRIV